MKTNSWEFAAAHHIKFRGKFRRRKGERKDSLRRNSFNSCASDVWNIWAENNEDTHKLNSNVIRPNLSESWIGRNVILSSDFSNPHLFLDPASLFCNAKSSRAFCISIQKFRRVQKFGIVNSWTRGRVMILYECARE